MGEMPRWVYDDSEWLNTTYAGFTSNGKLQIFDLVREVDILVTVEDIIDGKTRIPNGKSAQMWKSAENLYTVQ